jgi:queuine tRNA-ribosyltransferase
MAYLRHLFVAREASVMVLATVHNLHFFLSLMRRVRSAIISGCFAELRAGLPGGTEIGES